MGEQTEEHGGRTRTGTSGDPTPTDIGTTSPNGDPRVDEHRDGAAVAVRVGLVVRTIMNLLAVVVRVIACVFAAVLVIRIGLAFVAVNPQNVIVEWIVRFSDVLVWGFRDMFLPADPRIGLVANYGLAAVFWLVLGMAVAGVLSWLGRLVAGRSPRTA